MECPTAHTGVRYFSHEQTLHIIICTHAGFIASVSQPYTR